MFVIENVVVEDVELNEGHVGHKGIFDRKLPMELVDAPPTIIVLCFTQLGHPT